MAESTINSYSMDPTLWLYTSLTSGSSHIITATSRMETILKANRIPFKALDLATDEKARMLWGRRAGKDKSGRPRKIPGLVQMGIVIGDIVEVEDWNEYGELKEHIKIVPIPGMPVFPLAKTLKSSKVKDCVVAGENKKSEAVNSIPFKEMCIEDTTRNYISEKDKDANNSQVSPTSLVMSQLVKEAAQKAKDNKNIKNSHGAAFSGLGESKPQKLDDFLLKETNVEKDETYIDKRNKLNEGDGSAKKTKSDRDNYLNVIEQTNYQELVIKKSYLNLEDSPAHIPRFERQLLPNSNKRNIEELTAIGVKPKKSDFLNKIGAISDSKSQNTSLKEPSKRPAVILPPDTIYAQNIFDNDTNNASSLKPLNTISRKKSILQFVSFQDTADRVESIQSPNSTAWKPASLDQTLREVALADKGREVLKKS
ncbi:hypothetical protein Golomagni_02231 [Golovinomyces magnicellulatus]|nr:hypothetical protein Golomagni_02231 [Golovinomyces magnicellulatus]